MNNSANLPRLLERVQSILDRRMDRTNAEGIAAYASAIRDLSEAMYYLNGGSPTKLLDKKK